MKIFPEKIIHESAEYVCRKMHLQTVRHLRDDIGIYAYVMRDRMNRDYLFACKRYIDWSPGSFGRVSFTKSLVELAYHRDYTLIMLIKDEQEGGQARNYIYTYNPEQILKHGDSHENVFNDQVMLNFNIELAINMELTRRREILETRVEFKHKQQYPDNKDRMAITLTRFV